MQVNSLHGIIVPLVTPFTKDGEIDYPLVRNEIAFLLTSGVDAISPGGSTGEGAALEDEELCALVKEIRAQSATIPIVAGIIRNSTRAAVRAAKRLYEAGADALMVTPVSYNVLVPDDEGNVCFYREISDSVPLPIVIYNVVPQNTITPTVLSRLLDIERVVGIKQSVGGITSFYEMMVALEGRGKVFSATDEMMASTFELGADGAISAILSVFPKEMVQTWNWMQTGKTQQALDLQKKLYPVWKAIAGNQFPIRVKFAISLLGRDIGYTRSPICHMEPKEQERIENAMRKAGFLS
jgi:4-hydroxy-tetrahydrodipicolinate synthase